MAARRELQDCSNPIGINPSILVDQVYTVTASEVTYKF